MSKFKKLLRPRNLVIFFLVFSLFILISGIMLTRAANTELYYRLNHGMAQSAADSIAVGSGATCYNLVNNSGVDYFVPTKTAYEYNLFVAARERLGVTISPCQSCGDGSCNNGETCYSCPGDCVCSCNFAPDCPGYPGNTLVSYTCDNSIGYCVDAFPWVECTPIPPELEGSVCDYGQCWHSDQAGTCTEHLAPTWY